MPQIDNNDPMYRDLCAKVREYVDPNGSNSFEVAALYDPNAIHAWNVLSDYLSSRADIHGEYIALQLEEQLNEDFFSKPDKFERSRELWRTLYGRNYGNRGKGFIFGFRYYIDDLFEKHTGDTLEVFKESNPLLTSVTLGGTSMRNLGIGYSGLSSFKLLNFYGGSGDDSTISFADFFLQHGRFDDVQTLQVYLHESASHFRILDNPSLHSLDYFRVTGSYTADSLRSILSGKAMKSLQNLQIYCKESTRETRVRSGLQNFFPGNNSILGLYREVARKFKYGDFSSVKNMAIYLSPFDDDSLRRLADSIADTQLENLFIEIPYLANPESIDVVELGTVLAKKNPHLEAENVIVAAPSGSFNPSQWRRENSRGEVNASN